MTTASHFATPTQDTLGTNSTHTAATDSNISPLVYWPEPSSLKSWWIEVMDGALTPTPDSTK